MNNMDKTDMVNHPAHYADNCSIECIDCMELIFTRQEMAVYYLCTAFKYLWRWKHKNGKEDLEKANWYLDRYANKTLLPWVEADRYHEIYTKLLHMIDDIEYEEMAQADNDHGTP